MPHRIIVFVVARAYQGSSFPSIVAQTQRFICLDHRLRGLNAVKCGGKSLEPKRLTGGF